MLQSHSHLGKHVSSQLLQQSHLQLNGNRWGGTCSESKPVSSCDKAGIAPRWHQSPPRGRKAWHVAAMDNMLASGEHPNSKGDSPNPEAALLQLSACVVLAVFGLLAAFISCLLWGAPVTPTRCPAHTAPRPLTAHRGRPGTRHFGKKKPRHYYHI